MEISTILSPYKAISTYFVLQICVQPDRSVISNQCDVCKSFAQTYTASFLIVVNIPKDIEYVRLKYE